MKEIREERQNRFVNRNEPSQRVLISDISILKGVGGFAVISFDSGKQIVEYATSIDQAVTIVREKIEKLIGG